MTYRELLKALGTVMDEQLDADVTVHVLQGDQFIPLRSDDLGVSCDGDAADGILDHGHLYLKV